ncbi:MAG: hypothetical protein JRG81_14620 [Deltaproteobacteria bacterium]|nr:hypothetical protein [Deltaproteobacteria bacterium]
MENDILRKSQKLAEHNTQEQREMIAAISKYYPIKFVCQVLGLPRSTCYDTPAEKN